MAPPRLIEAAGLVAPKSWLGAFGGCLGREGGREVERGEGAMAAAPEYLRGRKAKVQARECSSMLPVEDKVWTQRSAPIQRHGGFWL